MTEEQKGYVECNSCGALTETTWEKACNEGCPVCCSTKVGIYGKDPRESK